MKVDMSTVRTRVTREKKTLKAMLRIYCQGHHGTRETLCDECDQLLAYALERLDRCPFQEGKTTCAKCAIHCYQPKMRKQIRAVMRYAGPRMLWRHPILALLHLLDGLQEKPVRTCGGLH